MDMIERVGRAIVRASWAHQEPDRPCPDDTPGTLIRAEATGAVNEIITALYEHGEPQAAEALRDLAR